METTLTWTGDAPIGTTWGPADGPVSFSFTELTGQRAMGGADLDGCFPKEFPRGQAIQIPYRKGEGRVDFGPPAFHDAWFADPALHLPPGRWRLQVLVNGSLAPGCDRAGRSLMIELDPIDLVIR